MIVKLGWRNAEEDENPRRKLVLVLSSGSTIQVGFVGAVVLAVAGFAASVYVAAAHHGAGRYLGVAAAVVTGIYAAMLLLGTAVIALVEGIIRTDGKKKRRR